MKLAIKSLKSKKIDKKGINIEKDPFIKDIKKMQSVDYKIFAKMLGLTIYDYKGLSKLLIGGNLKLPKTTAIFNFGTATECPSRRLGLCQAWIEKKVKGKIIRKNCCYAKRAETSMRPYVKPFRRKQKAYWDKVTAEEFAISFLIYNSLKPKSFTALRFNEASDFHTQNDLDKAEKVARILKVYGIICYCYTARSDLDFSHINALKVSGSGWTNEYVRGEFKMINKGEIRPKGYGLCCGDCRICNRCLKGGLRTCIIRH